MFGRKSAIHHGVLPCQSMSEGLPAVKYPYSQRAVPADSTSQPVITNLLTHSLSLFTFAADYKRVPMLIYQTRFLEHKRLTSDEAVFFRCTRTRRNNR
jgi:hypothetical protein